MSKCCQHAIDDSKVCVSLTFLSIKKNMIYFAYNYHMDQKEWKWATRWNKACLAIGVPSQKLKILMKTWFAF